MGRPALRQTSSNGKLSVLLSINLVLESVSLTSATILELLALLFAANGAPILAKRLLGSRWATALDRGVLCFDGRPLLGPSKTLRGLLAGLICGTLVAVVLGYPWSLGAAFSLASLGGDAFSSFIKRRLHVPASGMAPGLDQIPEAALPLVLLKGPLGINGYDVLVLVVLFMITEVLLSRLLYLIGLRDRPY